MSFDVKALGDICQIKQGKYLSPNEMSEVPTPEKLIPVIGGNGILGYTDKPSHTTDVALVTCRGSKCGLIQWATAPVWVSNNAMACDTGTHTGNLFLRYLFGSTNFEDVTTGSAQPQITIGHLSKKEFSLCPESEWVNIVEILGSLDDCITLLRETNTSLEAIVQAIFKSWFVDFDPVRAKSEGKQPEGMDADMAGLFPDSLEETELGMMPKGWSVGSIADLMRLHKGTVNPALRPNVEFHHFSLPAYDDKRMPIIEHGFEIKSNKLSVPKNAVLVSKLNPHIPRVWLPSEVTANSVCSTEFLPFVPNENTTTAFIYCLLAAPDFLQSLCQLVTGTSNSHQRIKPDGILSMKYAVPSTEVIKAFDATTSPLVQKFKLNQLKVQALNSIRDTLLPRLISGRLVMPDAEKELETVA